LIEERRIVEVFLRFPHQKSMSRRSKIRRINGISLSRRIDLNPKEDCSIRIIKKIKKKEQDYFR